MIKIMHFCSDSNIGGAGITLFRLVSCSDKSSFEHYVVLPKDSALSELLAKTGANIIYYNAPSDSSFSLFQVKEFIRTIRHISPHLIHTHGLVSARISAFLCGVKSRIYTRHTYREKKHSSLSKAINRIITTKAVAVSRVLAEQVKDSGISEKNIVFIENGCESFKKEKGTRDGIFTLLYHGRIEKQKGLDLAIAAVCRLARLGYSVRLLIVGDGGYKNELLRITKELKLEESVVFKPYTDDVSKHISDSDMIINCSYLAEGTSNSIIEGLSAGLPAVVSSVKGNIAVICDGEDGLIFESGSETSLTDCIKRLISDKELYNRLSLGAYKTYLERFTAKEMTLKYEKLWKDEYKRYYEK